MTPPLLAPPHSITPIQAADPRSGFSCGTPALDDYFARFAFANDAAGIGRRFVLRHDPKDTGLPSVLGFYTLSMASAESAIVGEALKAKLPKYPMPVALVGRLAVDHRATKRRLGEALLLDAIGRVVEAADSLGCVGIVVDAKDQAAEAFYAKYDFVTIAAATWPRRMFLPLSTARAALAP